MLTKKHFEWFAHFAAEEHLTNSAIEKMTSYFKAINPKFDKRKFENKIDEHKRVMRDYARFIK